MSNKYIVFPLFCLWAIITPFTLLHAQIDISSLDLDGDVTEWFDNKIGLDHTKLLSGPYQEVFRSSKITHQFFESNYWGLGSITYFGQQYKTVHLFYDIHADIVLLRHPTNISYYSQPIKLQQHHISGFELFGHTFRYYSKDENPPAKFGFYDEVYIGDQIQLIVRRSKEKIIAQNESGLAYESYDKYFIHFDDSYHLVKKRHSLLKALLPYKKELKRFIRQNQLTIAAGHDKDLVQLLSFFESIIKES